MDIVLMDILCHASFARLIRKLKYKFYVIEHFSFVIIFGLDQNIRIRTTIKRREKYKNVCRTPDDESATNEKVSGTVDGKGESRYCHLLWDFHYCCVEGKLKVFRVRVQRDLRSFCSSLVCEWQSVYTCNV
jgi:hypothetical protein